MMRMVPIEPYILLKLPKLITQKENNQAVTSIRKVARIVPGELSFQRLCTAGAYL